MSVQQPPGHSPVVRPRMSLYRYFIRLRDRLEFILLHYVDKDPYVKSDFAAYKTERNEKWAGNDGSKSVAGPAAITVINNKPKTTRDPEQIPDESVANNNNEVAAVPPTTPSEMPNLMGEGKETEWFPGFDFELANTTGAKAKEPCSHTEEEIKTSVHGKGCLTETPPPPPRDVSNANTISSVVDATLRDERRCKRKKSDSKPEYFDPDPFPREDDGMKKPREVDGGVDDLVMNIPVELRNRS